MAQSIQEFISNAYGLGFNDVMKADAPVLTSTSGVRNVLFGAMAFNQLNSEANAFAVMPKYVWDKSGFRAISADAATTSNGATAENGTVGESFKPTVVEITVTAATTQHVFEVSKLHELLKEKGDDSVGDMEFLRGYFATLHAKHINAQLLADVDTLLPTGAFESIDRITASSVTATAGLHTAGDEDIYGVDRSAQTWFNAQTSHGSTTDRTFSLDILESFLATLGAAGSTPTMIITGHDTKWRIIGLAQSSVRYQGVVGYRQAYVGLNGVSTEQGMNFGQRVATVYDLPLIEANAVVKDTISRIYVLDTTMTEAGKPKLGIAMLLPTQYYESGLSAANANPFAIGTLGTKGMYLTMGQLVCLVPAHQGSIRDLK